MARAAIPMAWSPVAAQGCECYAEIYADGVTGTTYGRVFSVLRWIRSAAVWRVEAAIGESCAQSRVIENSSAARVGEVQSLSKLSAEYMLPGSTHGAPPRADAGAVMYRNTL